jgi:hypothetical protein
MMRGRRARLEADPAPSLKLIGCQYFAFSFRLSRGFETFHGLFIHMPPIGGGLRIASYSMALAHSFTRSTKILSSLGLNPSGLLAARCSTRYQSQSGFDMSCTVALKARAVAMNEAAGPAKRRKRLGLGNRLSGRPVHVAGYQRADDRGAVIGGPVSHRLTGFAKRELNNRSGVELLSHA